MLHFCAFLENLLVTLSDILHLKPKENPLGRDSSKILEPFLRDFWRHLPFFAFRKPFTFSACSNSNS